MTRDRQERIGSHFQHVGFTVPAQSRAAELAFDDTPPISVASSTACETDGHRQFPSAPGGGRRQHSGCEYQSTIEINYM